MEIANIIDAIKNNRLRITDHADEEAANDRITFDEIYFSVMDGEIIEQYPGDRPYPSCLICGQSFSGVPIQSVWAYNDRNQGRSSSPFTGRTQNAGSVGAFGGTKHDAV